MLSLMMAQPIPIQNVSIWLPNANLGLDPNQILTQNFEEPGFLQLLEQKVPGSVQ
jgi:hypothetical protein